MGRHPAAIPDDKAAKLWQQKDKGGAMAHNFRQTEILEIARNEGRVLVEALAERFNVTLQTIRRDLTELAEEAGGPRAWRRSDPNGGHQFRLCRTPQNGGRRESGHRASLRAKYPPTTAR